jgi:hypothetical protein
VANIDSLPRESSGFDFRLGWLKFASLVKMLLMNMEQKQVIVREYVDAFNRGTVDGLCRLFTPDAQIFGVLGWGGLDKARLIWEELMVCFKIQLRVEAIAIDGDTVAVRYTERGTFSAPFRGTPPTGKSYEVVALEWFVLREGGIHQRWGARDSASMFRQMGIPLT